MHFTVPLRILRISMVMHCWLLSDLSDCHSVVNSSLHVEVFNHSNKVTYVFSKEFWSVSELKVAQNAQNRSKDNAESYN